MRYGSRRRLCRRVTLIAVGLLSSALARAAHALDQSVPRVHGDQSRVLLGDGTGIIVGIVDSGIDATHPALAGLDSLGQPRLVAEANFVRTEPEQSADDVFGHGTAVAGVVLSRDTVFTGLAPDARFVNSRVLDSNNSFQSADWVIDGLGFAVANGANVINLSLNMFSATSHGNTRLDLAADWVASELGIPVVACAGNISQASGGSVLPRAPGAAFNVLSVGRTTRNFGHDYGWVDSDSAFGPTSDGRSKPDLVAPGNAITTLNDDWEVLSGEADDYRNQSGCSFAAPHVTGLIAQQLEYGKAQGWSQNPLVVRATLLNSAEKVYDRRGESWRQTLVEQGGAWRITRPLDNESGAGQIDGLALADQYLAGESPPGEVAEIGWDFNTIVGQNWVDYQLPAELPWGERLSATLTWARPVRRVDLNSNGLIDSGDSFTASGSLGNLDLELLRDGVPLIVSASAVDNVEHLFWRLVEPGQYTLRVQRQFVDGAAPGDEYAVAWRTLITPPVPGDTNGDDRVDLLDLNAVRNNFGLTGDGVPGDAYPFDGRVDIVDLNAVRNYFGNAAPYSSVPEPGSLVTTLALTAWLSLMSIKKGRFGHVTLRKQTQVP